MDRNQIEDFSTDYPTAVQDVANLVQKVDVSNPTQNVLDQEATNLEILKFQSESQAAALAKTLTFLKNTLPLREIPQGDGVETPITVQAQREFLDNIGKENFLATRMAQQSQEEQQKKVTGGYFDNSREPICAIPETIAANVTDTVSDSALKLLTTFKGDTENEADNLREFLRAVYDVANTNKLSEKCVKNILNRKIAGTARKLIDKYLTEFTTESPPTLRELILKLEDRFMSEWSPEIANAKLSLYKKKSSQTYQALEGDIAELVTLAARGEEKSTRPKWIKNREIAVFKQAISEDDKQLLYNENQSRSITGLPQMKLSQMVDYLIKLYSEKNALSTASNIKNKVQYDNESIQVVQTKSKNQLRKEKRNIKQLEEQRKNQESLNFIQGLNNQNADRNGNYGNQRNNRGNGRGRPFNNRNRNGNQNGKGQGKFWNKNGNGSNKRMEAGNSYRRGGNGNNNNTNTNFNKKNKPRKFVTASMVNVNPNSCLKCNSPSHRFQEEDRCIYGKGNLMTKPCFNCQEGGHHSSICIKNQKPTLGAQDPSQKEALDPRFSKWPEVTKNVPEYETTVIPKNEQWLPSLFPN